jgi:hypothetical protein
MHTFLLTTYPPMGESTRPPTPIFDGTIDPKILYHAATDIHYTYIYKNIKKSPCTFGMVIILFLLLFKSSGSVICKLTWDIILSEQCWSKNFNERWYGKWVNANNKWIRTKHTAKINLYEVCDYQSKRPRVSGFKSVRLRIKIKTLSFVWSSKYYNNFRAQPFGDFIFGSYDGITCHFCHFLGLECKGILLHIKPQLYIFRFPLL